MLGKVAVAIEIEAELALDVVPRERKVDRMARRRAGLLHAMKGGVDGAAADVPSAPIRFFLKGLCLRRDVELPALDARAEFLVFQIDCLRCARQGIRRASRGAED